MIQLTIDNTDIALNQGSYREIPRVVETRNTTEAGTTHRSITRTGIAHLEVEMNADEAEKTFFDNCTNAPELTVKYWSEGAGAVVQKTMYLDPDSYSAKLMAETAGHRYYNISFTLEEF